MGRQDPMPVGKDPPAESSFRAIRHSQIQGPTRKFREQPFILNQAIALVATATFQ
jgi:hypothetical protein